VSRVKGGESRYESEVELRMGRGGGHPAQGVSPGEHDNRHESGVAKGKGRKIGGAKTRADGKKGIEGDAGEILEPPGRFKSIGKKEPVMGEASTNPRRGTVKTGTNWYNG